LEGDDHPTRLQCYLRELPKAELSQAPQIPAQYWPLLQRLLDLDGRRRPASMEEVVALLRKFTASPQGVPKGLLVAGLGVCLGTALLAQVLRGGWLGELFLWGSLTVGVLARVVLVSGLGGGLAGAALSGWRYQRNR